MENLSLQEPPPSQNGGQLGPAPIPQGPPQLPPQMFTTAAQLLDLTDKKLLLVLRDGRKLLGVLRSWDQFANLVLTSTVERHFVTTDSPPSSSSAPPAPSPSGSEALGQTRHLYCDIPRGVYLVRGENVLLLGEVDLDKDEEPPPGYVEGDVNEVFRLQKERESMRKKGDKRRAKQVAEMWGGEMEGSGEVLF